MSADHPLAIFCLALLLPSCTSDTEFKTALEAAAGYRGLALARELESLDRRFPDRLELKTDLGALYLASGDLGKAAFFLEQGEALARRKGGGDGLIYLLYANLAELRRRSCSFDESLVAAERALAFARRADEEDGIGVVFTKAKALAALGRKEAALSIFDAAKGVTAARMTAEDYAVHALLLAEKGRFAEALARTKARRARFGFTAGSALLESVLYERLGMLPEAAVAAFEELDRGRFHVGLADQAVLSGLAEAKKRLSELGPREGAAVASATAVLTGAELFTRGDFAAASAAFASVTSAEGGTYLDYLAAVCDAETGKAGFARRLAALETRYGDFQGFYRHLWRAMKRGAGGYGFGTARSALEKCILLAPGSWAAREARGELGILIGIETEEGNKLLLAPELDALEAALAGGASPEVLDSVVALLATKDNVYRLGGQILLKKAAVLPAVRSWLEKRKAAATGRLREELAAVLDSRG